MGRSGGPWTRSSVDDGGDADSIEMACHGLLAILAEHNSKEEPIIYPMAEGGLTVAENQRITDFIAAGAMPEGWVCGEANG